VKPARFAASLGIVLVIVCRSIEAGANQHAPASQTTETGKTAVSRPAGTPATGTAPGGNGAEGSTTTRPEPSRTSVPVSVATVVERIQQRIETEVKGRTATPERPATSAGRPRAAPARVTLRWRLTVDWPPELR